MTAAELPALLLSVAAVITASGGVVAAILAWLSSRRNGTAIASVEHKVDGRLEELITALKAKGVLDKAVSFAAGATEQRDAAPGVVVTTAAEQPPVPRRPLFHE